MTSTLGKARYAVAGANPIFLYLAKLGFVLAAALFLYLAPVPAWQMLTDATTPNGGIPVEGQFGFEDGLIAFVLSVVVWGSVMSVWVARRGVKRAARRRARALAARR